MSVEKKVVVTFALDPSFEKVKNAVSQLVSEVTKLGEAFNRVSSGMGGIGGGGGFKLDAKSGLGRPGTGSLSGLAPAVHRAAANVGGGVSDNLTRSVQQMSQIFRVAGEQGTGAMRMMSDMLKRNVEESDRNIEKLSRSLEKLTQHYQKLQDMKGRGALVDNAMAEVQGRYQDRAGQLNEARQHRAALQDAELQATGYGSVPDYAGYEVGRPWGQRLRSFFGGESNVGGVRGAVNGVAQRGLNMLGIGAAGGVAGVLGAGIAGYQFGASAINQYQVANINAGLEMPLWGVQNQARLGGIFGGNAHAIASGDVARAGTLRRVRGESDYQAIVNDRYAQILQANVQIKTPESFREALSQGRTIEYLKGQAASGRYGFASSFNAVDEAIARATGGKSGSSGVLSEMEGMPNKTSMEIERMKAMNEAKTQVAATQQKYVEQAMQRDPQLIALTNKIANGGLGAMSLARAAGISGNMVLDRQYGGGQLQRMDGLASLEGRANFAGYDVGEWVGMMQQIAGTAGRGLMHRRTEGLLSMQHGGLQNAVQLYGLGAQYMGGGDAGGGAMLRAIQSITGRGGLDPLAASQLTGAASNMILDPRFQGANPDDFFRVIGGAASTGTAGGDIRMARNVVGGLGAYGNILGGQIDPLQQALNASAAIGAAPSSGYYAHQGLMGLDPASMIAGLRGGESKMPGWMRMRGISHGMLRDYSKNMMSTMFSRLVGPEAAGTEMGQAAGRFMGAGGFGYMKGMKSGDLNIEMKRLAEGLAATMGMSRGDAEGLVRVLASQEGITGDLHGGGASQTASKSSVHGVSAAMIAERVRQEGVRAGKSESQIREDIENAVEEQEKQDALRKTSQSMARSDTPEGAINDISAALQNFVNLIRREREGRSGPTQASPPTQGKRK